MKKQELLETNDLLKHADLAFKVPMAIGPGMAWI
jgi:hypothetical protein